MGPSAGLGTKVRVVAPSLALAYFVVLGGTPIGEQLGVLRVVNTAIGAAIIMIYVWRMPTRADWLDRIVLIGLLLAAASAMFSAFPRQSLDALLAMVAYAGIFFMARGLVGEPATAAMATWTLRLLAVGIVLYAALQYLPSYIEWIDLTDASVVPPLGLPFVARPWGHAYDLTTLAIMLVPFWLLGSAGRVHRVVLTTLGVILAVVVFLLGSRAQWLAIAAASLLIAAVPVARRLRRRRPPLHVLVALGIGGVALAVVLGGPILERVLTSATINQRVEMWSAGVDAWLERPVTGFGPGSFPWVLQETTYFDTNSIHVRHPDNAFFQLLPEEGLLGLAAVALIGGGVVASLVTAGAYLALWPIAVFALDGLGANPTDFSYLIIIAAIWAGLGSPRASAVESAGRGPHAPFRWAMAAGIVLVAVPVTAALVAGLRFDDAANAVHRGNLAAARGDLVAASALDPSMALYVRQRGIASLLLGDAATAAEDLEAATRMNGNDDLAQRALAIALRENGEPERANRALDEAIRLQRSDKSSLMLRAAWLQEDGYADALRQLLPEIVLAWPTALPAPEWDEVAGDVAASDLIAMAIKHWQRGDPSPEPPRGQPFLLSVLGERPDLMVDASGLAGLSGPLAEAASAVGWCDPMAADLLTSMPAEERRSATYWGLRVQHAAENGRDDPTAARLYEMITFTSASGTTAQERMNPLRENNERGSVDGWGYDRVVIRWEESPIWLPLPDAGAERLLIDPRGARSAMDMTDGPGSCTAP